MTAAPSDAAVATDALRMLESWSAPDVDQEALRALYLAHVGQHEDAMWRTCDAGHLTASALVVDATHERVLLTLHPKVHRWLQLGGHCEPDDALVSHAALREACEESGIDDLRLVSPFPARLDRHLVPCAGPGTSVAHLDVQFVVVAPAGARAQISDESLDLAWWPMDGLPDDADDALRALVATAQSMLSSTSAEPGLTSVATSVSTSGASPTPASDVRAVNATPSR